MASFYVFGLLALLLAVDSIGAVGWNYYGAGGPDYWADEYPACAGSNQSPINIETGYVEYKPMPSIGFSHGYDQWASDFTMVNNGHTAVVNVGSLEAFIFDGGYMKEGWYKLAQFHFHWGRNDTEGSEHTLNGHNYPLEIHFVHYNIMYSSLGEAADKSPDGLAVLGLFFEIGDHNPGFDNIINHLADISRKGQEVTLDPLKVGALLPTDHRYFYRYLGSLTTPGCFESVVWTVFNRTLRVSSEQVARFRELYEFETGEERIEFDYRKPQPLNGRNVYSNDPAFMSWMGPTPYPCDAGCTLPISLFTIVLLALAALLY